jgi:hypothetical protein
MYRHVADSDVSGLIRRFRVLDLVNAAPTLFPVQQRFFEFRNRNTRIVVKSITLIRGAEVGISGIKANEDMFLTNHRRIFKSIAINRRCLPTFLMSAIGDVQPGSNAQPHKENTAVFSTS